ncbi:Acg family FMN-binding oxidoreductase [Streptomyces sp. URMC 129]|uniref:Acg family FMN-binding oxidoreductase n=1 Tax=Streptomyces sp. URMC 129 TaxID=3423407 RepID=UPI003F1C37AA
MRNHRSDPFTAWDVDPLARPARAGGDETARLAVRYAVLAPSSHNTQPWRFRVGGGAVELCADRARLLPVVDPDGRELVISCGAALLNLRLAFTRLGHTPLVQPFPEPAEPDLLARVRPGPPADRRTDDAVLAAFIPRRHTNRAPSERRRHLPADLASRLVAEAEREGAWLHLVPDARGKAMLAALVAEGDRAQHADRAYRAELARWMAPNRGRRPDGIRGYGFGLGLPASFAAPLLVRALDTGTRRAARDRGDARRSAALAVLGTGGDTPRDWLTAGQALQRVLLRATAAGAAASFFNQPVQVPALRPRTAALTGRPGHPQVLLRLGYGPPARPQPRRALADVLTR